MEPERPPMEVLDDERPPTFFERHVAPLVQSRAARAGVAVAGVLLLLGAWAVAGPVEDGADQAEAAPAAGPIEPPGLRPPPFRGRESSAGPWRVRGEVATRSGPNGNTFTFRASNTGSTPADPRDLQVEAGYLDRPEAVYTVACVGVRRTDDGVRSLKTLVAPGRTVSVQCVDAPEEPEPPRMAPLVVTVTTARCEDSARMPGV